jgi:hypothetical protein
VSNSDEFAFGLDPGSSSSVTPILSAPDSNNGIFHYTRLNPSVSGLTYRIVTSTDLVEWEEDLDATASQSVTATSGDVQTVEVTLGAALLSETKLFVRVVAP